MITKITLKTFLQNAHNGKTVEVYSGFMSHIHMSVLMNHLNLMAWKEFTNVRETDGKSTSFHVWTGNDAPDIGISRTTKSDAKNY